MKVLSYDANLCVGCYVCEETCSETWFKVADAAFQAGEKSSIRIHDDAGNLSAVFCIQCGECIGICPTGALFQDKRGVVRIQKKLCVGCLACVGFCPYQAMFHHADQTEPFKCVACGKCAGECPAEALTVVDRD